jgi:hypothetical protein
MHIVLTSFGELGTSTTFKTKGDHNNTMSNQEEHMGAKISKQGT